MKIFEFFQKGIWEIDTTQIAKPKAFFVRFLRIILIVIDSFSKNEIQFGASTLVYYSLLALVPSIALLLGVARGFHLENTLNDWLLMHFGEQKEIANAVINFARSALAEAKTGLVSGIGILILLWSAINILRSIELVLNKIWEVHTSRNVAKQFSDYLAMMVIAPIFIFASSGISIYISAIMSRWEKGNIVDPLIVFFLNLTTYSITWILFTFIYTFIPNTRVRFLPALAAGVIAGAFYQIIQTLYVYFQIGVSKYNAIYGTFAAIPLFLIWLYISWMIVLIGAKVAYAFQNIDHYEPASRDLNLNQKCKNILSLRITYLCVKKFSEGLPPPSTVELAHELGLSQLLTSKHLEKLIQAGVLTEVKTGKEEASFQPAKPIEQLTIKRVLDMINESGSSISFPQTNEVISILNSLKEFSRLIENSDANLLLKDI